MGTFVLIRPAQTFYERINLEFIYYGNISNDFLDPEHDVVRDAASRRRTLNKLKQYSKEDFNRRNYNRLDGKSAAKEFLADTFAGLAHFFRVSEPVLEVVAPDMKEYWNTETEYGTNVRYPMIRPLKNAMDRNDEICVVGHSLGSMIAYDTFWKFSRTGEYRPEYTDKQIDLFISIGSPLGDATVKSHLKGSSLGRDRRYPSNIRNWVNIAAEE